MNMATFQQLAALSLVLSSPSALADGSNDGVPRQGEAPSPEKSGGFDAPGPAEQPRGFSLGLRTGAGVPFGKSRGTEDPDGGKMSNFVSRTIPLQVDAGYFFNSHLYVGAFFQYGVTRLAQDCLEGMSCSASQLRFGVNAAYHFQSRRALEPWVGLGIGYERIDSSASLTIIYGPMRVESSTQGFEFASLQGGLDYRLNNTFSVGPFATFTMGQYSTSHLIIDAAERDPLNRDSDTTEDIEDKAIHGWLYGGLRAQARF
ncbi:outer membrane beta-barrel protein [Myxococcus sp. RHSTA-1-4]|uniref:outer membrane beta-barrel protein n=1 Tax=Myxococcus sp. RHSTA-1-4 TaxID=2874601 RepID=UPI001CBCE0C4|nr:outer membrane beta-barrel protein [Myxococcus sp. RHSTA-1-4]MBZ4420405.1 porin family protein [Myxococcus sp. RHSTA-1-4]